MLYKNERTVVLIDGANVANQLKNLNLKIDWKKFREWLTQETHLVRVVYYTAVREDAEGFQGLRKMLDFLTYNGYDVREKLAREYTKDNRTYVKGNMDVEIAVDIINAATNMKADNIILFSGDGDFCYALDKAKTNGSRVGVIAERDSGVVSDDLRKSADYVIDFKLTSAQPQLWLSPYVQKTQEGL